MAYRQWEIMERASTGAFMEEKDFLNKRITSKMRAVIKEYGVKFDPAHPVPTDDAMADAVWQAAWDFFRDVGVYNQDTHRVIEFSEEEMREALYCAPSSYTVGLGKDSRVFGHRTVEDPRPPFVIFSPDITYHEADFFQACVAYLKEPLLDAICSPLLEDFQGRAIQSKTPFEIGGSMEHAMHLRSAARLMGVPGICMIAVGTAETDVAQLSVSQPDWGIRPSDGRLVSSITEMMTNNAMLNKGAHYQMYGSFSGNLTGTIYGAYAGGAEGTAIMQAAYHLMGLLLYGCNFQQNFPFHLKHGSNTGREMLWVVSMYSQAVSRNTHLVQDSNGFANAGPGTDMLFYEAAAHSIASTVSGANLWETAPARNKHANHGTPLEARLAAEVGHAVARQGMTRAQADEVVNLLLAKYEAHIPDAPLGQTFQELYDVAKAVPKTEYLDLYYRAKEDIAALGVEFLY